ncbi:MAG: hypothetical protein JJE02_11200 [Propionibacteriales bacterium]|nr:hypothetical protein [Propionibacteriales bacterium]
MGDTVTVKALQLVIAAAVMAALVGCGSEPKKNEVPVPKGFDVPAGVTLTEVGTKLVKGDSASAVYQIADQTRSAITVSVTKVTKGDMADFTFFSLDDKSKKSTPYYINATIRNEGPAGLGGAPVPLYVHDSSDAISPPNEIVGNFEPCQNRSLPKSLLPKGSAKVCLVYLVPENTKLVSIDLQTADMDEPVSWKP